MAFMGCIFGLEETHNKYIKHDEEEKENPLDFLHINRLMNNNHTL